MDIIKAIEKEQMRNDLDSFQIGDHIRVHLKVKEGTRERIQVFEGTVIARQGSGIKETFTVRRVSYGVGVERVIPVHSPKIERIEVVRKGKIRRAKLYYLRERIGKAARVRTRLRTKAEKISTDIASIDTDVVESVDESGNVTDESGNEEEQTAAE